MQCHFSYSACGLGSDGTDRLVQLVQEMQHSKISKSAEGTLHGAKITGGGSGGTVCVIGKNCIRSSEQILEVKFCTEAWWPFTQLSSEKFRTVNIMFMLVSGINYSVCFNLVQKLFILNPRPFLWWNLTSFNTWNNFENHTLKLSFWIFADSTKV